MEGSETQVSVVSSWTSGQKQGLNVHARRGAVGTLQPEQCTGQVQNQALRGAVGLAGTSAPKLFEIQTEASALCPHLFGNMLAFLRRAYALRDQGLDLLQVPQAQRPGHWKSWTKREAAGQSAVPLTPAGSGVQLP